MSLMLHKTRLRFRHRARGNSRIVLCISLKIIRNYFPALYRPVSARLPGIELAAFIASLDQMPDLDAIINGEEVETPKEIDLQYAVATALVGRAIRAKETDEAMKVHGNILSYANRFPQREMGTLTATDRLKSEAAGAFEIPV